MERKIIMRQKHLPAFTLATVSFLTPLVVALQAQSNPPLQSTSHVDQKKSTTTHNAVKLHNDGERIFAQNCARCHTAPDGFSPRISGTIVRHMRVRASLSQHDEQELLRFFNP
jgi:mono/diheme cytochrome c family protein